MTFRRAAGGSVPRCLFASLASALAVISLARLRLIGAVFLAASVAAVFFTDGLAAMPVAGVAGGLGLGLLVDTPR